MPRRSLTVAFLVTIVATSLLLGHDMFLKPGQFFVAENRPIPTVLLNGTFSRSMNSIARARIADLSAVGPAGRVRLDTTAWATKGDTSRITLPTGAAGTYVYGVSTRPNLIELTAKQFNEYLAEDGLPDELARRKQAGETDRPAKERYSKHVKAVVQVGDARSEHFATALGYPAEIVPVDNPYRLTVGGTLRVRCLADGSPVAGALVQFGGRTAAGGRITQRDTRSDAAGLAQIPLSSAGVWYVKFIHMVRLENQPDQVTHESKWATLTFAVSLSASRRP